MKRYKLHYVMHEPSEETEDKYLVEVPALPGCRAWGNSPSEALDHIQSVAAAFIDSYHEHGDELPLPYWQEWSNRLLPRVHC